MTLQKKIEKIESYVKSNCTKLIELDGDILRTFVYKILAIDRENVIFCVATQKNYSDKEFVEKRYEFLELETIHTGTYYHEQLNKCINYQVKFI